jgi:hypothetical protein
LGIFCLKINHLATLAKEIKVWLVSPESCNYSWTPESDQGSKLLYWRYFCKETAISWRSWLPDFY